MRRSNYTAERVLLPRSNCTHLVIYDEAGEPIEVRAEVGVRRPLRSGPVILAIGWWNRGRKTWERLDGPMSITAACAWRVARRQREERAKAREAEEASNKLDDYLRHGLREEDLP